MNLGNEIKNKVKRFLQYEICRNSDSQLCSRIWREEARQKGVYQLDEFLFKFELGDFTNPESIRRIRQKLQEDHEELRGSKYYERRNLQAVVQTELFGD